MTIDARLKAIITSVAHSTLSDTQKAKIYVTISKSLHAAAVPVLVRHLPEDELTRLDQAGATINPQDYVAMMKKAIAKPELEADMTNLMGRVLEAIERELKSHFLMT